MRTSPREGSRDGFSDADREMIIRKAKDGYRLCVAGREHKCLLLWKTVDGALHLIELGSYDDEKIRFINELGLSLEAPPVYIHPSLSALSQPKTLHRIEIGPYDDKMRRLLNELGMNLEASPPSDIEPGLSAPPQPKIPPEEKPPVKELPTHPLAPPVKQVTSKISPPAHAAPAVREEDERWETLEKELVQYKIDGGKFRTRERSGGARLSVRTKGADGKWKEHYIGTYDERLKRLCAKLGIEVSGESEKD